MAIERKKDALQICAHLKYAEYLFNIFDTADENLTLKNTREEFLKKFGREKHPKEPLLNNFFGILRLVPLMYIRDICKNEKQWSVLGEDMRKISDIRHAFAHGTIESSPEGYTFIPDENNNKKENNKKEPIIMLYEEFNAFLYRIENNFADITKEIWV